MKILLAGGTGFLGRPLRRALASGGHDVVVLTRRPATADAFGRMVTWRPGAPVASAEWAAELEDTDVVINLAGEGIADKRWTSARKQALRDSRITSTRALVTAIGAATRRPSVFISGSAIGYYGSTGNRPIDESSPPGSNFLARLCVDWEAEARAAEAPGCRLVIVRTGVVLAADGGALKELIPPFSWFVGGPISSGRQYLSWIHRDDWTRLIAWTIEQPKMSGPLNATAPEPVTNEAFSSALGRALHRPSWLRMPRLPLRMLFGEMADVALVNGQRVIPRRALDSGFTFEHTDIGEAIASTTGPRT